MLATAGSMAAAALISVAQGVIYSIASARPLSTGLLHDFMGSFSVALLLLSSVSVFQLIGGFFATCHTYIEEQLG